MARKPIELERVGLQTPRERMWRAMKTLVEFNATEIEDRAHPITRNSVCEYIGELVEAGYVQQLVANGQRAGSHKFAAARYKVLRFAAIAPKLGKGGQVVAPEVGVTAMWRAMRVRKVFDAEQIQTDSAAGDVSMSLGTVKTYFKRLKAAGYLGVATKAHNGGGLTVYRLVKDTGPLPPAITRTQIVFDRNTGDMTPIQTAQEVCDALEA